MIIFGAENLTVDTFNVNIDMFGNNTVKQMLPFYAIELLQY